MDMQGYTGRQIILKMSSQHEFEHSKNNRNKTVPATIRQTSHDPS